MPVLQGAGGGKCRNQAIYTGSPTNPLSKCARKQGLQMIQEYTGELSIVNMDMCGDVSTGSFKYSGLVVV